MSTVGAQRHPDIVYPATIPFVVLHLACLGVVWTGVTAAALWLFVSLYCLRLFGITAGYHRYFAHRSYRTSRGFQLLLALLAQSTTQRGVLWWAAVHRHHHRHSDTELDVHSRRQHGFWYAHMGWIFTRENDRPDYANVRDLARYPELVWLDRHPYFLPAMLVLVPCWLVAGWSGVVVGFVWSTTLLYHVTFAINSLAHGPGRRPYLTGDESSNRLGLALLTFGEGWHNNHHAYQTSARLGFRRREIDVGHGILRVLERLGVVWDLRAPPEEVLENRHRPGRRVVELAALELAAAVRGGGSGSDATRGAGPSEEELRRLARARHPDVPAESLVAVAERARELLGVRTDGHAR